MVVNRLTWVAALAAAGFMVIDTVVTIARVGLVGSRPPLSVLQTALRIAIVAVATGLLWVRRSPLERLTLLTSAAAAGSSALFGFGLRSPGLLAFRLLSHLAAYTLVLVVAARMITQSDQPAPEDASRRHPSANAVRGTTRADAIHTREVGPSD